AQRAGSRVSWVGERLAARLTGTFVQPLKTGFGHIDLAAHFQYRGPAGPAQLQRNIAYGAHVGGNVLTGGAIATSRATDQYAIFIQQTDGQSIQFRFAAVGDLCSATQQIRLRQVQPPAYPAIEV